MQKDYQVLVKSLDFIPDGMRNPLKNSGSLTSLLFLLLIARTWFLSDVPWLFNDLLI
jgi:hypothetical protein